MHFMKTKRCLTLIIQLATYEQCSLCVTAKHDSWYSLCKHASRVLRSGVNWKNFQESSKENSRYFSRASINHENFFYHKNLQKGSKTLLLEVCKLKICSTIWTFKRPNFKIWYDFSGTKTLSIQLCLFSLESTWLKLVSLASKFSS